MKSLSDLVASIEDDDRDSLATVLTEASPHLARLAAVALSFLQSRPKLALHVFMWITEQDAPADAALREEWLRAHNNACYLAAVSGSPDECRIVVDRALGVAPQNPAIFHNAACVLCKIEDAAGALEAIRGGIAHG